MSRSASCFVTWVALTATAVANAAIRQDMREEPNVVKPASSAVPAEETNYNGMLRRYGIDPDSRKAQIVLTWVNKIRQDPVIATSIPGGADSIGRILLDPERRENFMSNGLARLTPADRLEYVRLITRFLDELVPVNCFNLVNMGAVMNRISLREMTDADVDQYLALLYKVLASNTSRVPIPLPTPQQYQAAESQLTRAIMRELRGDQVSIERFAFYTSNPSLATPSDVCWVTRVTLHAIVTMPEPERDYVLLHTIARPDSETMPVRRNSAPATNVPSPAPVADPRQ